MLESYRAEIIVDSRSQLNCTQCSDRKLVTRRGVGLRAQRGTYPGLPKQIHELAPTLSRTPGTSTLQVSPASCQLQEQTTVNPQLCQNKEEDSRFLGKNYFRLDRSACQATAGSDVTFNPNLSGTNSSNDNNSSRHNNNSSSSTSSVVVRTLQLLLRMKSANLRLPMPDRGYNLTVLYSSIELQHCSDTISVENSTLTVQLCRLDALLYAKYCSQFSSVRLMPSVWKN